MCLGFEPGVAGWKAQINPLSYGGTPHLFVFPSFLFIVSIFFFLNGPFCLFSFFSNNNNTILQQINVKKYPCNNIR